MSNAHTHPSVRQVPTLSTRQHGNTANPVELPGVSLLALQTPPIAKIVDQDGIFAILEYDDLARSASP